MEKDLISKIASFEVKGLEKFNNSTRTEIIPGRAIDIISKTEIANQHGNRTSLPHSPHHQLHPQINDYSPTRSSTSRLSSPDSGKPSTTMDMDEESEFDGQQGGTIEPLSSSSTIINDSSSEFTPEQEVVHTQHETKVQKYEGDAITCRMCHERMDIPPGRRNPRALHCLHTYCFPCLESLWKSKSKTVIECPICHTHTTPPKETGINGLLVNFSVVRELELLALLSDGSHFKCEECTDEAQSKATHRCINCKWFFCHIHAQAHKTSRRSVRHNLVTVEDLKKSASTTDSVGSRAMCSVEGHESEELILYCQTCGESICRECTLMDHPRPPHSYEFAKKAAAKQKEELGSYLNGIQNNISQFSSAIDMVSETTRNLHLCHDATETEITKQFLILIQALEQRKTDLLSSLSELRNKKENILNLQKNELENKLSGLQSAFEFTEKILSHGSDVEILITKNNLLKRLNEVKILKCQNTPHTSETMLFGLDLTSLLTSISNSGWVRDSSLNGLHAPMCRAEGEGIRVATSEKEARCLVVLADREGRLIKWSGENPEITLLNDRKENALAQVPEVRDNNNGTYTISYIPKRGKSPYTLSIRIRGAHIKDSPFSVAITLPPTPTTSSLFTPKKMEELSSINNLPTTPSPPTSTTSSKSASPLSQPNSPTPSSTSSLISGTPSPRSPITSSPSSSTVLVGGAGGSGGTPESPSPSRSRSSTPAPSQDLAAGLKLLQQFSSYSFDSGLKEVQFTLKPQQDFPFDVRDWKGAGLKQGVEVWRLENRRWIRESNTQNPKFWTRTCYIILYTYLSNGIFVYHVHCWVGTRISKGDPDFAMFTSLHLDDYLPSLPIQYREMQGFESKEFMNLFMGQITILEGGNEGLFSLPRATSYKPRLIHMKGQRETRWTEVPLSWKSLNHGDCFILDLGLEIVQWNGTKASVEDKKKAQQFTENMRVERDNKPVLRVLEAMDDHIKFWSLLGGKPKSEDICPPFLREEERELASPLTPIRVLLRIVYATGEVKLAEVTKGTLTRSLLSSDTVYILDTNKLIFSWVGKNVNKRERSDAIRYANGYLRKEGGRRFIETPLVRVMEGMEPKDFFEVFE